MVGNWKKGGGRATSVVVGRCVGVVGSWTREGEVTARGGGWSKTRKGRRRRGWGG